MEQGDRIREAKLIGPVIILKNNKKGVINELLIKIGRVIVCFQSIILWYRRCVQINLYLRLMHNSNQFVSKMYLVSKLDLQWLQTAPFRFM